MAGRPAGLLRDTFGSHWLLWRTVLALALGCGLVGWLGLRFVYLGYPLSMDEFMAEPSTRRSFAGVSSWRKFPAQWRGYASVLQPLFVQHLDGGRFWVSGYLPVSAALRTLGGLVGASSLVNPLLTATAVIAVYGVGRRMWPGRPGLALGAAVLLATSSQVLINGMTAYARCPPTWRVFNLVWLWLFLRGAAAGACAAPWRVGVPRLRPASIWRFIPCSWPPLCFSCGWSRRWRAARRSLYGGLCRLLPVLGGVLADRAGDHPHRPGPGRHGRGKAGPCGFYDQAQLILKDFDWSGASLMAKNLIRFITWQNPLTAPLLALSAWGAFQAKGTTRSLILGFVTTLGAVFALMPYQGHGWGYRYLHGLLGSAALLAAWQWGRMTGPLTASERAAARGGFALAAAASLLILFPLRALQVHRFVHPYAMAAAAIRAAPTDVVLVDDRNVWFGIDLARNDPYLRNRPLILHTESLSEYGARQLCARATVSVFDSSVARRLGILQFNEDETDEDQAQLADDIRHWTCRGAPVAVVAVKP